MVWREIVWLPVLLDATMAVINNARNCACHTSKEMQPLGSRELQHARLLDLAKLDLQVFARRHSIAVRYVDAACALAR